MLISHEFKTVDVKDESRIWAQMIAPNLKLPRNVNSICQHGFTEMLNNVIDHSLSDAVKIKCEQSESATSFEIEDDGVGIFAKLRGYFGYDSDIHALIELVKGKLTVAPEAHSGEGIFFSSKMFDHFSIESGSLAVSFDNGECAVKSIPERIGTLFSMRIANDSRRTDQEIFDQFTDKNEFIFCKTKFFVSLAAFESELTSRSQAKRIAVRLDSFNDVEFDFSGVDRIGQSFADELIRVWPLSHPGTQIRIVNAEGNAAKMIAHVIGRDDLPQPERGVIRERASIDKLAGKPRM